jgi:integrase/recombinase XerD
LECRAGRLIRSFWKPEVASSTYKLCTKAFETTRCGPFTTRRIQQIVQSYRSRAGLTQTVHPHLFRHQMLTYLTAQGLSDAQIQLSSGHASKKSLEVYQHLSLEAVEDAYQAAVRALEI